MNRTYRTLSTMLGGLAAVALAIASPSAWADDDDSDSDSDSDNDDGVEIPFDEHEIFFELNYTDQDLGIHALIDGEAWKRLITERDDNERKLLDIRVKSKLRQQGLTELFFESAEPEFEELSPAEFFARFPEGEYDIEGRTLEGDELESETEITHLVPASAEPALETGGGDFDAAEDCDTPLTGIVRPVTITWDEVTDSIDPVDDFEGFPDQEPIDVVNYQVVVELDETPFNVSAILSSDATSFDIPAEILDLAEAETDGEVKFEVLVREESFNQTGVESCFVLL